jgi:acyl-CoA thioester hydrolase
MERQGLSLAVSEVNLRLHASARYDDLVRVNTRLVDVQSRRITFEYEIRRVEGDERLATASTSLISISPEGKPMALPPAVRARLSAARE